MQAKRISLFTLAIVFAVFLTGGCSDNEGGANTIGPQLKPGPERPNTPVVEEQSSPIRNAMLSLGADCDKRKRSRSGCKWQGTSYTLNEPKDWDAQMAIFRSNCEAGVFSDTYNVISDKKSWIVSAANGATPTSKLHAELAKKGGVSSEANLVKLCDL